MRFLVNLIQFFLLISNMASKNHRKYINHLYDLNLDQSTYAFWKKNDICVGKSAEKLGSPYRQRFIGQDDSSWDGPRPSSSSIFRDAVTQSSSHVRNAVIMESLLALCLTFVIQILYCLKAHVKIKHILDLVKDQFGLNWFKFKWVRNFRIWRSSELRLQMWVDNRL